MNVAKVAEQKGVRTLIKFFGRQTARQMVADGQAADLIIGNNVLAQVPDEPPFFESPYGPGTLAGTDGSRQPVEAELTTARNLGSRLARVAGRLKDLRASRASAP